MVRKKAAARSPLSVDEVHKMPVRKVTVNGRTGYQWGSGKVYTGPGAQAKAAAQGRAAYASGYRSTVSGQQRRTRGG
jgi:hypothetical protein